MKVLLYGFLICSLLFYCSSKKEKSTSETTATLIENTTAIIKDKELSEASPYIDTLTISFAEGQDYIIYVEDYSEQGPEGSLRHFTMHDQKGREVFKSFDEELYFMSDGPEPEYIFNIIPWYGILSSGTNSVNTLTIGLKYIDENNPNTQSSVSTMMESENLAFIIPGSADSTYYTYGCVKMNRGRISFLPALPSQTCLRDIDSLINEFDMIDVFPLNSKYNLQDHALLCALDTSIKYSKRVQLADSLSLLSNEYMYNHRYAVPIFVTKYIMYHYSFFKR